MPEYIGPNDPGTLHAAAEELERECLIYESRVRISERLKDREAAQLVVGVLKNLQCRFWAAAQNGPKGQPLIEVLADDD